MFANDDLSLIYNSGSYNSANKKNYNNGDNSNDSNYNNNNNNNTSISFQTQNIRRQLFNLNNLTLNELKLKWFELYKTAPNNLSRNYLIKGIAYKIQSLACMSDTSEYELKASVKIAKDKLISKSSYGYKQFDNGIIGKAKNVNLLPPVGSIIRTCYKGRDYVVKVVSSNADNINSTNSTMFEYEGNLYKSLSAIAFKITGVRWNGYVFFKLKKTLKQ